MPDMSSESSSSHVDRGDMPSPLPSPSVAFSQDLTSKDVDNKLLPPSTTSPLKRSREGDSNSDYFVDKVALQNATLSDERDSSSNDDQRKPDAVDLADNVQTQQPQESREERSGDGESERRKKRLPLSFLPGDIEDSINSALLSSRASSLSSLPSEKSNISRNPSISKGFLQHISRQRQHRAMSVPANIRSNVKSAHGNPRIVQNDQDRRGSIRAQQLALLASQARLASIGTTSVEQANRTESAVKAAVLSHVDDARLRSRHSVVPGLLAIKEAQNDEGSSDSDEEDSNGDKSELDTPNQENVPGKYGTPHTASSVPYGNMTAWSAVLGTPTAADTFMENASSVARSWANGFYAFEKQWVGNALERERRRSSAVGPTDIRPGLDPIRGSQEFSVSDSALSTPADVQDDGPAVHLQPSKPLARRDGSESCPRSLAPLLAAQKRLSDAREEARRSLNNLALQKPEVTDNPSKPEDAGESRQTESSGKLVDVLSDFASLLERRTEGLQGIDRLAQDARRLSAVPLSPLVREGGLLSPEPAALPTASPLHSSRQSPKPSAEAH